MENQYKKQEGYTQGIEQSLIPTFPRYSLMRLIWRGYVINLLLDVVYAGYLVLECIITIYFTGLHSLLAIATVYPIYQIAIRGPIISFSLSAASFVHKELEVGHTIFANAYLLGYIILSVCWCTLVSLTIAPASRYIVSVIGTSDDLYATNYLVLCSTLGGLSLILDEGMTTIHIVEQRYVLIFTHMLTRYLLKSTFLLLFYTICNKIGQERGENMTSTLATAPIVTDIVVSIPLSVWILFITCHKTIYNYPLATSLNLLKQNKYPWQWKVYKRIIVNSIPHYLKTLYEPFMLLVTNILVAKYYTNSDESITKRISLLLFYLFRHIFMTSSRSFAISYYTSMQTYYFHNFYQCVEAILVKLTLLVYSIGLLVGFTFLVLSPFLMRLLLPINVVDSFILSTLTEVRQALLLDYCETTIRKAAIAGIILVGLDMVLIVQTLRETYILNTVVCLSRIVSGLVFVLIVGLMNQDNSSVENALLIAEIPTAIGAVFLSIEQIYEHIFLGRLEMFHAMTSKTNSSSLSATDWAEVHQTIAESKAEKRSAYKYLRFLITGRSIND